MLWRNWLAPRIAVLRARCHRKCRPLVNAFQAWARAADPVLTGVADFITPVHSQPRSHDASLCVCWTGLPRPSHGLRGSDLASPWRCIPSTKGSRSTGAGPGPIPTGPLWCFPELGPRCDSRRGPCVCQQCHECIIKPTVTSWGGLQSLPHPALSKNPSPPQASDLPCRLFFRLGIHSQLCAQGGLFKRHPPVPSGQKPTVWVCWRRRDETQQSGRGGGGGFARWGRCLSSGAGGLASRVGRAGCLGSLVPGLWVAVSSCVLTSPVLCVCVSAFPPFLRGHQSHGTRAHTKDPVLTESALWRPSLQIRSHSEAPPPPPSLGLQLWGFGKCSSAPNTPLLNMSCKAICHLPFSQLCLLSFCHDLRGVCRTASGERQGASPGEAGARGRWVIGVGVLLSAAPGEVGVARSVAGRAPEGRSPWCCPFYVVMETSLESSA